MVGEARVHFQLAFGALVLYMFLMSKNIYNFISGRGTNRTGHTGQCSWDSVAVLFVSNAVAQTGRFLGISGQCKPPIAQGLGNLGPGD